MLKNSDFDEISAVAITGIGMISPLGINAPECWDNMLKGKSGIRKIERLDPSKRISRIGGQLPEKYFELEKATTTKRQFKQTVRTTRIAGLTAKEAYQDASLDVDALDFYKCGAITGISGSSVRSPDDLAGPGGDKFTVIREMSNASSARVSIDNGFKGPAFTVSAGCASGSQAVIAACDLIRGKVIDIAIAGGADICLTENNIRRGNFASLLSRSYDQPEKAMRPFDKNRDGFVLANGGCALILESYHHAVKRNANVYAWIRGYSSSWNTHCGLSSIQPTDSGLSKTIEMALTDANTSHKEIGYVSANGISTIDGDRIETSAIKKAFGKHAFDLMVSSQKSMIGHTLAGSGAIELATTALTLNTQKVTPTINLTSADPECDLNYVPNSMVEVTGLDAAISNSFALGGHNCVIVLSKTP